MKNSKFVIDKLAKLFEQGLISSKDIAAEIMAINNSSIKNKLKNWRSNQTKSVKRAPK